MHCLSKSYLFGCWCEQHTPYDASGGRRSRVLFTGNIGHVPADRHDRYTLGELTNVHVRHQRARMSYEVNARPRP